MNIGVAGSAPGRPRSGSVLRRHAQVSGPELCGDLVAASRCTHQRLCCDAGAQHNAPGKARDALPEHRAWKA
eukprot:13391955-Alexandrium_andersonii.AAC.1